jgi:hypothetical protein
VDNLKLSAASLVLLIAGALMLIASFLDFSVFTISGTPLRASWNAWSNHFFLITTIPALLGSVVAVQVALAEYAPGVRMPERVLGLTWAQIDLVLGFQATIMMVAFLLQDTGLRDKGIGLFLMLAAAIALLVGAVMRMREKPRRPRPPAF